jgi:NifU-like protein
MVYPPKVRDRVATPKFAGHVQDPSAQGKAISLECGTCVEFAFAIDTDTKLISQAAYRTNGCGFMIAAAEMLADKLNGKLLTELHGLGAGELNESVLGRIDDLIQERSHCITGVLEAAKTAFNAYREQQVQEFVGEKALICTCFGVSEEKIENVIRTNNAHTVDLVGELCNAGTGCGSCQMMIQELIESTRMSG